MAAQHKKKNPTTNPASLNDHLRRAGVKCSFWVIIWLLCGTLPAIVHGQDATTVTFTEPTHITAGDMTYANSNIIVNGTTLTVDGAHAFESLQVINGGILTHSVGQKLDIMVAGEVTVDADSAIDISGKGLGFSPDAYPGTGGSHGGRGGDGDINIYVSGPAYGDYQEPVDVGRGGRVDSWGDVGTRGGGAIKLTADTLALDGSIRANGDSGWTDTGGGAGGSIWLDVGSLRSDAGTAEIQANGGNSGGHTAGGGGGGRIAVYYETLTNIEVSAITALGGDGGYYAGYGGAGTIYLKDATDTNTSLRIVGMGSSAAYSVTPMSGLQNGTYIVIENAFVELLDDMITANLDIRNSRVFLQDGVVLSTSMTSEDSNVHVQGGLTADAAVTLDNSALHVEGNATLNQPIISSNSDFTVGGQLAVPDNNLIIDGFRLSLAQDHVFTSVHIKNGGVLTTPVASGNFVNGIALAAQTITIEDGSRIDVSGKGLGFDSDAGPGTGGSHGGKGGDNWIYSSGPVYGDDQEPVDGGRGGRGSWSGSGSRGGGAIKLTADTLVLDGSIRANGDSVLIAAEIGGGAGGSIWLDVGTLQSETEGAAIEAKGGKGGHKHSAFGAGHNGGGGGGGRVAVYYELLDGVTENDISVVGGLPGGSNVYPGEAGSIYLSEVTAPPYIYNISIPAIAGNSIGSIIIEFSQPIDAATLTVSDILVTGQSSQGTGPANVTAVGDKIFQIDFAAALADGQYTLQVGPDIFALNGEQMDQNRNDIPGEPEDVYTFDFLIDLQAPEPVTLSAELPPAVNESNETVYSLTGNRENGTSVLINGVEVVAFGSGPWSADIIVQEGENRLSVVARDVVGHVSTPVDIIVDADSIKPEVQSVSPTGAIADVPARITVTFTETGSGIDLSQSLVAVTRNSTQISGTLSQDSPASDQVYFTPSSALTEGNYVIQPRLVDNYGNFSTQPTHTFILDYTPPSAPVLNNYPAVTNINTYTFTGTKEAGSRISVNGQVAVGASKATTWSYETSLAFGDNHFSFTARDAAGNVSAPTVADIRYDDKAPGPVAFSVDAQGDGTELHLSWAGYDEVANGNDIASYRVYLATQPYTGTTDATIASQVPAGVQAATLTALARGALYYISIVAVDKQGLQTTTVTPVQATPEDIQAPEEISAFEVAPTLASLQLSWQPSANSAGDLASYRIGYTDQAEAKTITLAVADLGSADPVTYTLTDLSPASAHQVTVSAVDADGNASVGLTNPGVTLLSNPANLQAEAFSGRAELSWSPVMPHALVKHYAIYVQPADFTSVAGLSPQLIVPKGDATQSVVEQAIAGLGNGTTVYLAVTAVNLSEGENPQVTAVAVTPEEDTQGPTIEVASFLEGAGDATAVPLDLTTSPVLQRSGTLAIEAVDETGISRIELSLDGQPLANLFSAVSGQYRQPLDLVTLTDGAHTLHLKAYDALDNLTEADYSFTIALAAPDAPFIVKPAGTLQTNQTTLALSGTSAVGTQVRVLNNGVEVLAAVPVNSQGEFGGLVTLDEGDNLIVAQAQYPNRGDWSVESASRRINLNTQIPDAPTGLGAVAAKQGEIHLSWNTVTSSASDNTVTGYNLYRATAAFTEKSAAGVEKVNNTLITDTRYTDLVLTDGDYIYAVTAVNQAANESAVSANVAATADSAGPKIIEALYTPSGAYDDVTGRMAPGRVGLSVRFDEPLRNTPYFALVPDGGVPMTVELTKSFSDDTLYSGQFQITETTPSGTAYVVMSAYDNAGNRGTEVDAGATVLIDTDGPDVTTLSINPSEPLQVDDINGLSVDVAIHLNDEVVSGEVPVLIPLLDQVPVAGYEEGIPLHRDILSEEGTPLWLGTFDLPVTAGLDESGQPSVATLTFSYAARDDLNNTAIRINGQSAFQVYQGDLPPLAVPRDLTAQPQADGKVSLSWSPVAEAQSYILYRQGPEDETLVPMDPMTATSFTDTTGIDGVYQYAVASVRRENQQESISAPSEIVTVNTDSVAPAAPANLSLELNGAGIVARWEAPGLDNGLTYNLYRTALGEGEQIVDITGLTPIETGIPELIALDTNPNEAEHSYVVTAVDSAGNESLPSATVYLNFGLLPVSHLSVTLTEGGFPQLSWRHNGQAISHYRVYRDAGEGNGDGSANSEPLLLTPEPLTHTGGTTTYVDATYNGGQVSDGAHQQVRYTVVAVDAFDVESVGRTIVLPALSVTLLSAETSLNRGVMNNTVFRVDNKGGASLTGLRLHAAVRAGGVLYHHQSEAFGVAAGSFAQVPIVIGGYAELDGISDITLRLEHIPQAGDSITIHQTESVLVGDSSLRTSLAAEDFTRGASGTISFTLENTSAVETEIVMASNNGNASSPEVRLILEDMTGNVLAVQPVQQFTGGVINAANGQTLARLAPGDTFTSAPVAVPVPSAAPDQVRVRLVIDKFHYHSGRDTHVAIGGIGTRTELMLSETPYYAELASIEPAVVYGADQTVTLRGQAVNRATAQPMANVPVKLVLNVRGFEQTVTVYSDSAGAFAYMYVSNSTSGIFRVSVLHPDMLERPNHGEFQVVGASVSPRELDVRIPRNYTQTIPIRVSAGYDSMLTNVRLTQIPADGQSIPQVPPGITAIHGSLSRIDAQGTGYINLQFNGDNSAAAAGQLRYRVEADNFTDDKALGVVTLNYSLSEAKPALVSSPTFVNTGVGLSQQTSETVTLTNKGLDSLINGQITLTQPDGSPAPTWLSLNTYSQLGTMAIGESRQVQFTLAPGTDVSEGNYEFTLAVTGDNFAGFSLPVFVAVTQSGKGNAFFHVSDIYTATLDENQQLIPGLQGARIHLQNEEVLTETFDLTSDANGEATFEGIPAGRYSYRASAFDHSSVSGRIWIKPGVTTAEEVFLVNSLVNVEWSVQEITLEDRYEVKLEATYETNVPVAVVLFDPLSVQLPVMKQGDVFQGELTLTNHGLIRATNISHTLPQGNDMVRFEFLREIPSTLEAGEVFTLPYRIQALRDFDPEADATATGGGCGSFNAQTKVDYQSECANGTEVPGATSSNWNSNWGGNCGGDGNSTGANAETSYYYNGSGGGGGISYSPAGGSITEEPLWCRVETECEECSKNNASAK